MLLFQSCHRLSNKPIVRVVLAKRVEDVHDRAAPRVIQFLKGIKGVLLPVEIARVSCIR